MVGISTSIENIASYHYAREKGVCPVEVRAIVRYAYKTWGNSSGHFPLASSNFFFHRILESLIYRFDLAIFLGMGNGGEAFYYSIFFTKMGK